MAQSKIIRVLLVDDEPMLRMIAGQGLEDAGYDVVEADCAEHALDILKSRTDIAILFTDVNMPGSLDGLALATLVHERWPAIQLVVTSGRSLTGPVPDDGRFVAKPYSLSEMTDVLAEVAARLD